MAENFENKATRGSISQIILTALSTGDKYGYEICKDIERLTNGKLILKQPSLYSCLRRMEEQNLISSYWEDSSLGGRRHYYSITEKGKQHFEENKNLFNQEELLNNLPENLNNKDAVSEEDFKENEESYKETTTFVANQENLFNLAKNSTPEIKKISAEDEEKNKSFLQFDFFEQDIKVVKNDKTNQEISVFTNKFSVMDNHTEEIEPQTENSDKINPEIKENLNVLDLNFKNITTDSSTPLTEVKIVREEVFSSSNAKDDADISENKKTVENLKETEPLGLLKEEIMQEEHIEEKINNSPISSEKIEWKKSDFSDTEKPIFETKDYRGVIGKLYNNSQIKDPYEQNKYHSFKEIFPTSQLELKEEEKPVVDSELNNIVQSNTESNIACDDIKMLNNLYNLQGINIKTHNDIENKKQNKVYTDKNKLNMVASWIISLIMIIEVLATYFILKKENLIMKGQSIIYILGGAVAVTMCLIFTLENMFDRFKLIIINKSFSKMFIPKLLIFIILIVVIFALNLAFGMSNLVQVEFLSYWLVPTLLSTNIMLFSIVYYLLFKSKNFNS